MNTLRQQKSINEYIKKYIYENDLINRDGNILYMEKTFTIASVLRYCIQENNNKNITKKQIESCFAVLKEFISGNVNIVWNDNKLKVIKIKEGNT